MQQTLSPIDGRVLIERSLATSEQATHTLSLSKAAALRWRNTPLSERISVLTAGVMAFAAKEALLAKELSEMMGRPIRYTAGEITGFVDRATTMLRLAPTALADVHLNEKPGFTRFIRREPLGACLVLSPWNYPYLCAVNAVIPALVAGNTVILKHSDQTPLCSERMVEAFLEGGLPEGVFQFIHTSHARVAKMVADPRVDSVSFTGSVQGGRAISQAAAGRFISVGLELGGKDAAYVRADADVPFSAENLVDGAFFNSGQSCCGIERIYVHADVYDSFVQHFVRHTNAYVLGDPMDPQTTLGPVVRVSAAKAIRAHVADALEKGATALIDPADFPAAKVGTPYLAPQVLVNVTHEMRVMTEETFGPIVGIQKVHSDDEALQLINDSDYGLTASIWSEDVEASLLLADAIHTGTVFLNRCDCLDPELPWVGVKQSGHGCTLSHLGLHTFTRPKSFHFRRTHS